MDIEYRPWYNIEPGTALSKVGCFNKNNPVKFKTYTVYNGIIFHAFNTIVQEH